MWISKKHFNSLQDTVNQLNNKINDLSAYRESCIGFLAYFDDYVHEDEIVLKDKNE